MFELMPYCRLDENYLDLYQRMNPKDTERYFCGIFLCKKFTKKQIIKYFKNKSIIPVEECIRNLKMKLGIKEDFIDDASGREIKRQKFVEDEDEIMMDRTIRYKLK